MKCDLMVENEYSAPSNNKTLTNKTSNVTNIANNKSAYDTKLLRNVILEDNERTNSVNIKSDRKRPITLSTNKESHSSSTNETFVRKNSSSKPYIQILDQTNAPSDQMMAALGQPSAAPPSCGAGQPSVDPR